MSCLAIKPCNGRQSRASNRQKKRNKTARKLPKEEEQRRQPLFRFRSPLDPDAEFHVVLARKSLWKRRLESMLQRYPSDKDLDCSDSDNDESIVNDEDRTWIMDSSQSSYTSTKDRWGESSCRSLPNVPCRNDDGIDDEDELSLGAASCPQFNRWGQESTHRHRSTAVDQGRSAVDKALRPPSRSASPIGMADESLQDHSDESQSPAYPVAWLENFYSTVTEIRRDGICSKIENIRAQRASTAA